MRNLTIPIKIPSDPGRENKISSSSSSGNSRVHFLLPASRPDSAPVPASHRVDTGTPGMLAESELPSRALEVFLEAICSFHAARTIKLETDA